MLRNSPSNFVGQHMQEDTRCCGSGTCLIDADGRCWCGQQWDGDKLCSPLEKAQLEASRAGAPGERANTEPTP
jgi:hypothetical protein